jgi:TolB-like protein
MEWSRKSSSPFPETPELFVIARNSSFTFKGKAVDIKQVTVS